MFTDLLKGIFFANLVLIGSLVNANAEEIIQKPDVLVGLMTNDLLSSMEQYKDTVDDNPKPFFEYLEGRLIKIIDFSWIAKNVMGPYRKSSSEKQRQRFTEVFRRGLVETYGRGLLSYSNEKIEVLPLGDDLEGKRKVKVQQNIYSKTSVYPVSYSMRLSKRGEWKITNVILNGVNLGKTFRNQFVQAAKKYEGDIDKVIDNWLAKV